MGFTSITIEKYVRKHIKNNPSENEVELRKSLNVALIDYQKGEKCTCGNDIWVVGSASLGNACFTCITGESKPNDDYELDIAIKKGESVQGRRNIQDMNQTQLSGFFDDNGYEINTELINKPSLCSICKNNDNQKEELLCNMTRYDQRDEDEFQCDAFIEK